MKTVTQKDFQALYRSPGYEQTEEMRRFLANLPDRKIPERAPVIRKRRVAFILAAALMLMGIAAVAVSVYSRTLVSWDAEIRDNDRPETESVPQELVDRMGHAVNTVPENLYATAVSDDGSHTFFRAITGSVSSPDELARLLDEAGYAYPERTIPDGWAFASAVLEYACDSEGQYELVSKTPMDGFTLYQYRADRQHLLVTGYTVFLENGTRQATFSSALSFSKDLSLGYPSEEGLHAETVSVPGMEDAVFTSYPGQSVLMMCRTLEKPVSVLPGIPSENGDTYEGTDSLAYEILMYQDLDKEEILPLYSAAD